MGSSKINVALLFISLFSISSTADQILDPECGYCSKPHHKPKKPVVEPPSTLPPVPKLPVPPVTVPTVPVVPKLPVPPVNVPKLPVPKLPVPPVTVPKLPGPKLPVDPKLPVPPVTVPEVPVPKLPVDPKLPVPPVTVPEVPVPKLPVDPKLPPVTVPNVPIPKLPVPVGPPNGKGKKPCPPPASCPIDTLKLGACVDLLGGLVHIGLGDPAVNECCPIISGLAEVEAAACLCTTLKVKALNLKLYVPIALQLLLTCGKTPPPGYTCSV